MCHGRSVWAALSTAAGNATNAGTLSHHSVSKRVETLKISLLPSGGLHCRMHLFRVGDEQ